MVPVLNTPFLEHVIMNLKAHGVSDIILAQHHLAAIMAAYFGDGARFGVKLTYVIEDVPRGTAGAVKNAEKHLDGTFFVLNGDIFHDRDFTAMLEFHKQRRSKATIVLTPVDDPTVYGVVETDSQGRVRRFLEKPKLEEVTTNMINAGTYVLEPEVLNRVPPGTKYSFERELFPGLLSDGQPVYAFRSRNYWMDTGTPEKYLQLHRDLLAGKCDGYSFDRQETTGKDCRIHPSVRMVGRVILGQECIVERDASLQGPLVFGERCHIGAEAVIEDSVVWDRVTVGSGAVLRSCAIANDCTIGAKSLLTDAVLGDHITLGTGSRLQQGARVFPDGSEGIT
jgi:mannose-1-phosphate guanylyltransferase